MSFNGSASTAIRSAYFPGATTPTLLGSQITACGGQIGSSSAAATLVADLIAAIGDIP